MKVSLISPKWDKMTLAYPPLGLAYVAAALERAGHVVRIHVFSLEPRSPLEKDIEEVEAFGPDLVGITSSSNVHYGVLQTAGLIKEHVGCPIVVGGPHATTFPEKTVEDPNVDFVVVGEGEETAVDLVDALQSGRPLETIRGLYFKRDGRVQRNRPRPLLVDLNALPFPARHLLELDHYPLRAKNGEPMTTIMTSRGCPFDCGYCFKGMSGRTYRQRTTDNVLTEIREIVEVYGIRNIYFIDDFFMASVQWLTELCNGIVDGGLDIRWQCQARAEAVTPELLELMYRAGCREIHYSVESGNEEVLRLLTDHVSHEAIRTAVTWTKEAGILTRGYFMLGLPSDTERTMKQTIKLACDFELDQATFSVTIPFPGTRLWQEVVRRNPSADFNRDYARAYYHTINSDKPIPIINVSLVSNDKLTKMASLASSVFNDYQRKKRYAAFFGRRFGTALWYVSRIRGTRRIGHSLQRLGLFRNLPNNSREPARAWS